MSRHIVFVVALLAACGIAAGAAAAPQAQTVLGAGGEIFAVRAGTASSLLGTASPEPVLVLDVERQDGSHERHLVPGTDGGEPEDHPFLLLDRETGTLYLLWESVINNLHPILNLASFRDGTWSDQTEIVYNAFSPKSSPQMLVLHDEVREVDSGGELRARRRTVVHVAWTEEDASGATSTYYAPLVLDDDVTLHGSAIRLDDLVATLDGSGDSGLGSTLPALKLQAGRDQRRVTVAFPTGDERLGVVELDLLPGDLGRLAEEARGHIIDFGARYGTLTPDAVHRIADEARGHIIDFGVAFHPEVVRAIADEARGHIIDFGARSGEQPPDLERVAAEARGHIIDFGAKLTERGLRRVHAAATRQEILLEVAHAGEGGAVSPVLIHVTPLAAHAGPDLGGAATYAFVSAGGQEVVLARTDQDRVIYRQLAGGTWSPILEFKLGESFDLDDALRVLEARVDSQ